MSPIAGLHLVILLLLLLPLVLRLMLPSTAKIPSRMCFHAPRGATSCLLLPDIDKLRGQASDRVTGKG
jgi:hypothetical protein